MRQLLANPSKSLAKRGLLITSILIRNLFLSTGIAPDENTSLRVSAQARPPVIIFAVSGESAEGKMDEAAQMNQGVGDAR